MDLLKGTSSATENPLKEFTDAVGNAPSKDDSGVPVDNCETGGRSAGENYQDVGEKHKDQETEVAGNCEANVAGSSNLPPSKRSKVHS